MSRPMRIVLCDDHQLLMDAFATALTGRGHQVVATALTPAAGITAVLDHRPDVCIMDIGFPQGSGLLATTEICGLDDGVKVLVLSGSTDPSAVRAALDAGAVGFVPKRASIEGLLHALEQVADGEVGMEPSLLLAAVHAQPAHSPADTTRFLTPRESEVLLRISEGESTKEIARSMGVSYSTARTHIQNAMSKLRVSSRLQASALISRENLAPQLRAIRQRA
jgi:two-component system, NarL family, nitrate/nitrite response regulator NarL